MPPDRPYHLWGGKRIAEGYDDRAGKLTLALQGPAGGQDDIFIAPARHGVRQVSVGGQPASFFRDCTQGVVHGRVTFTSEPLKIELLVPPDGVNQLPAKAGRRRSIDAAMKPIASMSVVEDRRKKS